jgi:hypothetical protein
VLAHLGRAVQVDPIKPTLKAPGIKLLKLKYDKPLSSFALKFYLRRYTLASFVGWWTCSVWTVITGVGIAMAHAGAVSFA